MRRVVVVAGLMILTRAASAAPKPALTLETPKVNGALDTKVVAPVVVKAMPQLLACYKATLVKTPGVDRDATLTFAIERDGKVGDADAGSWDDSSAACITAVAAKLKFPASKVGTDVAYGLVYEAGARAPAEPDPDPDPPFAQLTGDGAPGMGFGMGAQSDPPPNPTLFFRQPAVTGQLEKLVVRRTLNHNRQKLTYCYEKALLMTPAVASSRGLTLQFTIRGDGTVAASKATGAGNADLEECSAEVVEKIQFTRPKDGHEVPMCQGSCRMTLVA